MSTAHFPPPWDPVLRSGTLEPHRLPKRSWLTRFFCWLRKLGGPHPFPPGNLPAGHFVLQRTFEWPTAKFKVVFWTECRTWTDSHGKRFFEQQFTMVDILYIHPLHNVSTAFVRYDLRDGEYTLKALKLELSRLRAFKPKDSWRVAGFEDDLNYLEKIIDQFVE